MDKLNENRESQTQYSSTASDEKYLPSPSLVDVIRIRNFLESEKSPSSKSDSKLETPTS